MKKSNTIFIQSASYFNPGQERENNTRAMKELKKSKTTVYLWCEISNASLPSALLLFSFLLNWPIFWTWRLFFTAIKNSLTEICLSLTLFLDVINLIEWLTGCFVYYSCFFVSCPFNRALILLTLWILTLNTYLLKTFLSIWGSMPGICAEVQQQINLPVTNKGKEDDRLSGWNVLKLLHQSLVMGGLWVIDLAKRDTVHVLLSILLLNTWLSYCS